MGAQSASDEENDGTCSSSAPQVNQQLRSSRRTASWPSSGRMHQAPERHAAGGLSRHHNQFHQNGGSGSRGSEGPWSMRHLYHLRSGFKPPSLHKRLLLLLVVAMLASTIAWNLAVMSADARASIDLAIQDSQQLPLDMSDGRVGVGGRRLELAGQKPLLLQQLSQQAQQQVQQQSQQLLQQQSGQQLQQQTQQLVQQQVQQAHVQMEQKQHEQQLQVQQAHVQMEQKQHEQQLQVQQAQQQEQEQKQKQESQQGVQQKQQGMQQGIQQQQEAQQGMQQQQQEAQQRVQQQQQEAQQGEQQQQQEAQQGEQQQQQEAQQGMQQQIADEEQQLQQQLQWKQRLQQPQLPWQNERQRLVQQEEARQEWRQELKEKKLLLWAQDQERKRQEHMKHMEVMQETEQKENRMRQQNERKQGQQQKEKSAEQKKLGASGFFDPRPKQTAEMLEEQQQKRAHLERIKQLQQQQQQAGADLQADARWGVNLTLSETRAAARLVFARLLPGGAGGPVARVPELQLHPEAMHMLGLLRKVWEAHAADVAGGSLSRGMVDAAQAVVTGGGGANQTEAQQGHPTTPEQGQNQDQGSQSQGQAHEKAWPEGHCSTKSGVQLLAQVVAAAEKLRQVACEASSANLLAARRDLAQQQQQQQQQQASSKQENNSTHKHQQQQKQQLAQQQPGSAQQQQQQQEALSLPYVTLRRAALLVLHLAYLEGSADSSSGAACSTALQQVTPRVIAAFASAFNCSRASRRTLELFHISKCGGTSMCQLAAPAGLHNPAINMNANCLVPGLDGEPRWTRQEPFMLDTHNFWAAVNCTGWTQQRGLSCAERAARLRKMGINFYANERTLHDGDGSPGSDAACPEFETVTVLRQPLERVRSHVVEVDRVYHAYRNRDSRYLRNRDLNSWRAWAPAVLDNFMVRSLLGRQMLCRDFGSVGEKELESAMLALTALDHVLILEEEHLTDLGIRAGLGWNQSLHSKHYRWSAKHDLEQDLHFPQGTLSTLDSWNQLDLRLYTWGRTILTLDAAFHTAVAALAGRAECVEAPTAAVAAGQGKGGAPASIDGALAQAGLRRLQGGRINVIGRRGTDSSPGVKVVYTFGFANVDATESAGTTTSAGSGTAGPGGARTIPLRRRLLLAGLREQLLAPSPGSNASGSNSNGTGAGSRPWLWANGGGAPVANGDVSGSGADDSSCILGEPMSSFGDLIHLSGLSPAAQHAGEGGTDGRGGGGPVGTDGGGGGGPVGSVQDAQAQGQAAAGGAQGQGQGQAQVQAASAQGQTQQVILPSTSGGMQGKGVPGVLVARLPLYAPTRETDHVMVGAPQSPGERPYKPPVPMETTARTQAQRVTIQQVIAMQNQRTWQQ